MSYPFRGYDSYYDPPGDEDEVEDLTLEDLADIAYDRWKEEQDD